MDHSKALSLLLLAAVASGCAALIAPFERPFREPGERLKTFPEKVWAEKDCDEQKLPFFEIERLELYPRRLEPGGVFKQRLVYALCPTRPTAVVTGSLETKILHRGETIVHRLEREYDLKPGRWVIDAFVELPPQARDGLYAFELRFRSRHVNFEKLMRFVVDPADD